MVDLWILNEEACEMLTNAIARDIFNTLWFHTTTVWRSNGYPLSIPIRLSAARESRVLANMMDAYGFRWQGGWGNGHRGLNGCKSRCSLCSLLASLSISIFISTMNDASMNFRRPSHRPKFTSCTGVSLSVLFSRANSCRLPSHHSCSYLTSLSLHLSFLLLGYQTTHRSSTSVLRSPDSRVFNEFARTFNV